MIVIPEHYFSLKKSNFSFCRCSCNYGLYGDLKHSSHQLIKIIHLLLPFISCLRMDRSLVELPSYLVLSKTTASPFSSICSNKKSEVGVIFNLSVHHLKVLFGTGYPLPKTLTQKDSSSLGVVFLQ